MLNKDKIQITIFGHKGFIGKNILLKLRLKKEKIFLPKRNILKYKINLGHIIYCIGSHQWRNEPYSAFNTDIAMIANVLKNSQEELRLTLNDLGANIQKLDDWITRTVHNPEKMANASKSSRLVEENRNSWVEYIRERLDIKRTFPGITDPIKINEILKDVYNSLLSGDHLKHGGAISIYGTKNVANRLNASRVLHFKDAVARHEYDITFGEPSLKESVLSVLENSTSSL